MGEREDRLFLSERDFDIHVLSTVSLTIGTVSGVTFVLTGSYAVEALTGYPLQHNDFDANIFTPEISRDLPLVALALSNSNVLADVVLQCCKRTDDRLEYEARLKSQISSKKLELQFVEVEKPENEGSLEFTLKSEFGKSVSKVSLTPVSLRDSNGRDHEFLVKSLPYVIATWVIRISGFARNPKRPIEDRDLEALQLLLGQDYNYYDVIWAMKHHPQRPEDKDEGQIFEQVLKFLSIT